MPGRSRQKETFPNFSGHRFAKSFFCVLKTGFLQHISKLQKSVWKKQKTPGSKRPSPRARADKPLPVPKEHKAEHTITTGRLLLTQMRTLVEHTLWSGLG